MNLYPKNKIQTTEVKKFIIIFYSVGILGFIIPYTKDIFITITPFALILSTYLLALYHGIHNAKDAFLFLIIFILGFIVEIIGVNTGLIFGTYNYGKGLGIKLFNTPPLIGINWLFLTYTSVAIARKFKIREGFVLITAPLLLLAYDFVLEQVAPKMDMWHWQNASIPIKNYAAWYFIGLFFVFLLKAFKVETKNPLAAILFISQFVFFALLTLLL